jgi:hypothetical protein
MFLLSSFQCDRLPIDFIGRRQSEFGSRQSAIERPTRYRVVVLTSWLRSNQHTNGAILGVVEASGSLLVGQDNRPKYPTKSLPILLPASVNLPVVHNVLALKHVVVGMLGRCQTRMICQNPNARPNSQTFESVLILRNDDAVLLRHLADR